MTRGSPRRAARPRTWASTARRSSIRSRSTRPIVAFSPTETEVDWARRVVTAHGEAQAQGRGVVLLDGRLIENLHVEDAHRVLALAGAIAAARVTIGE